MSETTCSPESATSGAHSVHTSNMSLPACAQTPEALEGTSPFKYGPGRTPEKPSTTWLHEEESEMLPLPKSIM